MRGKNSTNSNGSKHVRVQSYKRGKLVSTLLNQKIFSEMNFCSFFSETLFYMIIQAAARFTPSYPPHNNKVLMLFRKLYRKSQIFQTNNNFFLHKILKAQEGGTQNKFNFELFGIFAPPPKLRPSLS